MEKQDEWVSETVKTRIERNIRDGIEQQFDVEVIGVTASLSEGGKHPGVDSVRVTLDPGAHPHGQWEIEPVKPVDIDVEEDREESQNLFPVPYLPGMSAIYGSGCRANGTSKMRTYK